MPRFAANLSMLYNELDFLDRFAAAASDGFTAVEYLFPYAWAPEQLSATLRATYVANLRGAAEQAAPHGIDILIEPINPRDMPGFYLQRQDQAHALLDAIDRPNVKVQMDLYHCQIVEGDLAMKIRHHLPGGRVGHIQIAGVPQRHEPDLGEIHHPYLFELLDRLGYEGWIGCEYRPARGAVPGGTSDGLGWLRPYLA